MRNYIWIFSPIISWQMILSPFQVRAEGQAITNNYPNQNVQYSPGVRLQGTALPPSSTSDQGPVNIESAYGNQQANYIDGLAETRQDENKEANRANKKKAVIDAQVKSNLSSYTTATLKEDGKTYTQVIGPDGQVMRHEEGLAHTRPGTGEAFSPSAEIANIEAQVKYLKAEGKALHFATKFPKEYAAFQMTVFLSQYLALKTLSHQDPLGAEAMWNSMDPSKFENWVHTGGFFLFMLMNRRISGYYNQKLLKNDKDYILKSNSLGKSPIDIRQGLVNARRFRNFKMQQLYGNLGMAIGMTMQTIPVEIYNFLSSPEMQACWGFEQLSKRPFYKFKKVSKEEQLKGCDAAYDYFALTRKVPEWSATLVTLLYGVPLAMPLQYPIEGAVAATRMGVDKGINAGAQKILTSAGLSMTGTFADDVSQVLMQGAKTAFRYGLSAEGLTGASRAAFATLLGGGGLAMTSLGVVSSTGSLLAFLYIDAFMREWAPNWYQNAANSFLYGVQKAYRSDETSDLLFTAKNTGWKSDVQECNSKQMGSSSETSLVCQTSDPFLVSLRRLSADISTWKETLDYDSMIAIQGWSRKVGNFQSQFDLYKNAYDHIIQAIYNEKILEQVKASGQFDLSGYTNPLSLVLPLYGVVKPGGIEVSQDDIMVDLQEEQKQQMKNIEEVVGALSFNSAQKEVVLKSLSKKQTPNPMAALGGEGTSAPQNRTTYDDVNNFQVKESNFRKALMIANLLKGSKSDLNLLYKGDGSPTAEAPETKKEKTMGSSINALVNSVSSAFQKGPDSSQMSLLDMMNSKYETFSALDPYIKQRIVGTINEIKKNKGSKIAPEHFIAMGIDLLNNEIARYYTTDSYMFSLVGRVCESCVPNYDETYFKFLMKLKQMIGVEAQPMYEPGRGYLMMFNSFLAKQFLEQNQEPLKMPQTTGIYSTPNLIDHVIMQMICGARIDQGQGAVRRYEGTWDVFRGPKVTSFSDNMSHICKSDLSNVTKSAANTGVGHYALDWISSPIRLFGHGLNINPITSMFGFNIDVVKRSSFYAHITSWYPDLMYHQKIRVMTPKGEVSYNGAFDYVRNRLDPSLLQSQDGFNTNFAAWWDKYAQPQFTLMFNKHQSEYYNQVAHMLSTAKITGQHSLNTGPLSNGVFEVYQQEIKYYLVLLGEFVKDLGQSHQLDTSGLEVVDEKDMNIDVNVLDQRTSLLKGLNVGKTFFALTHLPTFSLGALSKAFPDIKSQNNGGFDLGLLRRRSEFKSENDTKAWKFQYELMQAFSDLINSINKYDIEEYEKSFKLPNGKTKVEKLKRTKPGQFNIEDVKSKTQALFQKVEGLPQVIGLAGGKKSQTLDEYQKMVGSQIIDKIRNTVDRLRYYIYTIDAVSSAPEVPGDLNEFE